MRIKPVYILIIFMVAGSCIDPYYPNTVEYLDLPVIEGLIHNGPGPYTVRLSRSIALNNMDLKPIRGAEVFISDDAGNEEKLAETEAGTYQTGSGGIQGETGRQYRVTVLIDGKTYRSDYQLLQEPLGIDSIYSKIESRPVTNGYTSGLQFYLNTKEINDPQKRLLWNLTETFQFESEMILDHIYYSPDSVVTNYGDSGRVCWRTVRMGETFTYSASNLTHDRLENYPLHFVDGSTNRLSVRYSVMVSQYTVSESAYQYWHQIHELNAQSGSLYTKQPYQVKGNLQNTESPNDVVLGHFTVAGVSEKRIFVDPPPIDFDFDICTVAINIFEFTNPRDIRFPVYSMEMSTGIEAFASLNCFDCRLRSGSENMPEFWEK